MRKASRSGGEARPRPRLAAPRAGFTLVEVVVAMALMSLLLAGFMALYGAGWKTQSDTYQDSRLQNIARATLNSICQGNTRDGYPGLLLASVVATQSAPNTPALSFRALWTDALGIAHDDAVTYYVSGNKLYRVIVPFVDPLSIATSGGQEVATSVASFTPMTEVVAGRTLVKVTLELKSPTGRTFAVMTKLAPRGQVVGPMEEG